MYSVVVAAGVGPGEAEAQARQVQQHGFRAQVWQQPRLRTQSYYQHSYASGLRAFNNQLWDHAAEDMRQALETEPESVGLSQRVPVEGLGPVCYLPHFYRSVALANLGDCKNALREWDEATKRGVSAECKPESFVNLDRLKACRTATGAGDTTTGAAAPAAPVTHPTIPRHLST